MRGGRGGHAHANIKECEAGVFFSRPGPVFVATKGGSKYFFLYVHLRIYAFIHIRTVRPAAAWPLLETVGTLPCFVGAV